MQAYGAPMTSYAAPMTMAAPMSYAAPTMSYAQPAYGGYPMQQQQPYPPLQLCSEL